MALRKNRIEPHPDDIDVELDEGLDEGLVAIEEHHIEDEPLPASEVITDTDVRINVSKELAEQFSTVKKLQDKTLETEHIEVKEVVGIINAVTTIIKDMAKIQQELHTSQNYAVFKQVVIATIKEADKKTADVIVQRLEDIEFEDSSSKVH